MPTILTIQDTLISFEPTDIQSVAFAACAQVHIARNASTKGAYEALKEANNVWFHAALNAPNKTSYSLAVLREASAAIHSELDALIRRW